MTAAAADSFRVLVLAPEDAVAASVRTPLGEAGLPIVRWEPDRLEAPGRPPVDPDMLIVQADDIDIVPLLRRGEVDAWLKPGVSIVILTTRAIDREERRNWLRAGAWEIVRLPLDGELFALQVRNFLRGRRAAADFAVEDEPYEKDALLRVAEENLALAMRHRRPLSAAAFGLDWGSRRADADALALMERLAVMAHDAVRGSDLVGVTPRGSLLVILPDTDPTGAQIFADRLKPRLEARLREWGVLARVLSGHVVADLDQETNAEDVLAAAEDSIG